MAQQDKTDFYWNGVLSGAINNLYYDLINVDVVRVPYVTDNRNSSFFLQTRRSYTTSKERTDFPTESHRDWDVVDVQYLQEDKCNDSTWTVYVLLTDKLRNNIRIHKASIINWCVQDFDRNKTRWRVFDIKGCWAFKFFVTDYVKWKYLTPEEIKETIEWKSPRGWDFLWIQINKYEWGTTVWYFSDVNVEDWTEKFVPEGASEEEDVIWYRVWQYILVYESLGGEQDGFSWQVRMIIWIKNWRLMVNAPWQWFKTLSWEAWEREIKWWNVSYRIFDDWWEVVWFTDGRDVYIETWANEVDAFTKVYNQIGLTSTKIISVASASDKIFVLTDNWYIHYSNYSGYDKFFIQDDMYAWIDKTSIASYRDMIIAFWKEHIWVGIPDSNNKFFTLYNQTQTIWLWSRYSYGEYNWDMLFVSNDKRLLALSVANNASKYMLEYQDVWEFINSKLSTLSYWDEVFIWNAERWLRIFLQTVNAPYVDVDADWRAKVKSPKQNIMTRIFKYDTLFKVWTEDLVTWILLQWVKRGIYFWENWLYQRSRWHKDTRWDINQHDYEFHTHISAYLIENENNWLDNHPLLFNLAKLNRLITTLWPWVYSHDSKLRVTAYSKWIWSIYEFSIDWDNNKRIWLITTKYSGEKFSEEDEWDIKCMLSTLQDSQKEYQPKCTEEYLAEVQDLKQSSPWCESYEELLTLDRWVCIDDSLFQLAPTMPLTTSLWENQNYSTQIKIELIWWVGDVVTFGGWLWELFIAPLFTTGPDWEYQLQPNTDC